QMAGPSEGNAPGGAQPRGNEADLLDLRRNVSVGGPLRKTDPILPLENPPPAEPEGFSRRDDAGRGELGRGPMDRRGDGEGPLELEAGTRRGLCGPRHQP